MATPSQLKRLQALIWVLIFGGLLTLVFGLSLQRYEQAEGLFLVIAGALVAAVGALLILLRASLTMDRPDPD